MEGLIRRVVEGMVEGGLLTRVVVHDLAAHIGCVRDAQLAVHDDRKVELLVVEEAGHGDVIAAVPQCRLRAGARHQRPASSRLTLTQQLKNNTGTTSVWTYYLRINSKDASGLEDNFFYDFDNYLE